MVRVGLVVVGTALMMLVGCSGQPAHGRAADRPGATPSRTPSPSPSPHAGSLTAAQRYLATSVARREQRQVRGVFVGATALASSGAACRSTPGNDVEVPQLVVRLVWQAGASFGHARPPGGRPDGPRQALLLAVDLDGQRHDSCLIGARYRHVGAGPGETLLYGEWPDPSES